MLMRCPLGSASGEPTMTKVSVSPLWFWTVTLEPEADPPVVVGLLDDDGVLDNRLQGQDAALDQGLIVAGVLVRRGVLGALHGVV